MHHIYHTEGIILWSRDRGETSKYYQIFTRDHGLIFATAQGVRKIESKLRHVLQDFSYIKLDLVRGRDMWRVTSALKTGRLEALSRNRDTLQVYANIAHLLRRLLADEESNPSLFLDVIEGLAILEKITNSVELRNAEVVLVLRILNNLGYIGDNAHLSNLIKSPLDLDLVFEASQKRGDILSEINKALRETQL